MKKALLLAVILLGIWVSVIFAVRGCAYAQPTIGRNIGVFWKGFVYSYQDNGYQVSVHFMGYTTTVLVLYLATSPDNPHLISREIFVSKKAGEKYWIQHFGDFEMFFMPVSPGNMVQVWVYP